MDCLVTLPGRSSNDQRN